MIGYTDNEDALLMRAELEAGVTAPKYDELLTEVTMNDLPSIDTENNDTSCPADPQPAIDAVTFFYT